MAKLMTTAEQMEKATRPEQVYYIKRYERGYTETCHNDRWEVPGKTHIDRVSKSEYERSSNKHEVSTIQIPLTFNELRSLWEGKYKVALRDFADNPNLNTIKSALFAVKQYGFILDVKRSRLLYISRTFNPIIVEIVADERASINKILAILEEENERLLKEAEEAKRLKAEKKKEREAKKAERDAKKAEKERLKKIADMEKELEELKNK